MLTMSSIGKIPDTKSYSTFASVYFLFEVERLNNFRLNPWLY